jgi:hypothetical protein
MDIFFAYSILIALSTCSVNKIPVLFLRSGYVNSMMRLSLGRKFPSPRVSCDLHSGNTNCDCNKIGQKNRSSLTSEGAVGFLFQELPLKALLKGLLLRLSALVIYSKRNGCCVLISKGSRGKREDSCLPNFRPKKSIQLNFRRSSRISIPRVATESSSEGSSAETTRTCHIQQEKRVLCP